MEVTSYLLGKKAGGGGSEPTGTIDITSNGVKNVKNYASANVNVQPDLETKSVTITENTTTTITPTSGKDGISSVQVTTNVPTGITPTGTITITENGTHDVTNYASASVNVPSGGETIDTIAKLNAKANEFVNYLLQIPNSYSASTTENVTLYTPDTNFKTYMIVKRSNGKYRGYWLETGSGGSYDGENAMYNFAITNNNNNTQSIAKWDNSLFIGTYYFSVLYRSSDYSSVQNCLNALKNSSTSYTKDTAVSINISKDSTFDIPFSNTFVYDVNIDDILTAQKISSNETIEVIPTT